MKNAMLVLALFTTLGISFSASAAPAETSSNPSSAFPTPVAPRVDPHVVFAANTYSVTHQYNTYLIQNSDGSMKVTLQAEGLNAPTCIVAAIEGIKANKNVQLDILGEAIDFSKDGAQQFVFTSVQHCTISN